MKHSRKPVKLNTQQQAGSWNNHSKKQVPKSGLSAGRAFLICIPISIIGGILLEIVLRYLNAQGTYVFKLCKIIITALGGALALVFYDMYKDDSTLNSPLPFDTNPWAEIWERILYFLKKICQDALCILLLSIFFSSSGITAWAMLQMGGRLLHTGREFITYDSSVTSVSFKTEADAVLPEQPLEPNVNQEKPSVGKYIPTSPTAQSPEIEQPEVSTSFAVNESNTNTHSGKQTSTVDASERAIAEKAQHMQLRLPTMDWTISEIELNSLLFCSGEYIISSDCTLDEARDQITTYLQSLEQEQLSNTFDAHADQSLKDDIAYASKQDATLQTSVEKDLIIKTRLNAYTLFGKETLAKLLAEDFHCYALAYKYHNEDWDTMVNYYFQSLKWLYERFKYTELTEETRREILISIRYRYNDIMTYSEWNSEQWIRAKLLADVFNEIITDTIN